MAKAPPQTQVGPGGQPQMMVYMVAVPYSADGSQQQAWAPDGSQQQVGPNGSFGAGQHMMVPAMQQQQQPGQNWNTWQEMPNQQFGNQPHSQPALQDYSAWGAAGQQQPPPMQDHSQHVWQQPQQHQQHQQQQPQQQPIMPGASQSQPIMGNAGQQQQPMTMPPVAQQDNQSPYFYGVSGQQPQAPPQVLPIPAVPSAPAVPPATATASAAASAPASAKPKKKGLMNKKISKDGDAVPEPEPITPMPVVNELALVPQEDAVVEIVIQKVPKAAGAAIWEPLPTVPGPRFPANSADNRSMIKALNLQPISAPSNKGRPATNAKHGGNLGREAEIQALRDFANTQRAKAPGVETTSNLEASAAPFIPQPQGEHAVAEWQAGAQAAAAAQHALGAAAQPIMQHTMPQRQPQEFFPQQQQQPQAALMQPVPAPKEQPQQHALDIHGVPLDIHWTAASQAPAFAPKDIAPFVPRDMQPVVQAPLPVQALARDMHPAPLMPGGPTKAKGIRLKNVTLKRPGEASTPKPEAEKSDIGEDRTPKVDDGRPPKSEETALVAPPKVEETQVVVAAPVVESKARASEARVQSAVLLGRTKGFDRTIMLQFWKVSQALNAKLGYRTATREETSPSPGEWNRYPRKDRPGNVDQSPASWRQQMGSKPRDKKSRGEKETLTKSANAYKIGAKKNQGRDEELQRDCRSLLNKICPENRDKIIERISQIQLDTVDEMEIVVNIIFDKVTADPHYCETYVDMIYALKKAYPEFPSEAGAEAPIDFRRMLVNTCQDKFEDMLTKIEDGPPEMPESSSEADAKQWLIKTKRSAMATMKFIGHLYVRQLLAAAVIRRVVGELLDGTPPELQVEYALELLQAVGRQFDSTERDKAQLSVILDRLNLFKNLKGVDGKPCVSKRVQFIIQDLVDLRMNGWVKKGFKEEAKSLDQVKEEQDRDEAKTAAQAGGGGKGGGKNYGGGHGRRH